MYSSVATSHKYPETWGHREAIQEKDLGHGKIKTKFDNVIVYFSEPVLKLTLSP